MDCIAIVGLSIHGTDVAGLGQLRRPAPGAEVAFLRGLADELGASELAFLATCNRVEVVFAREEGEPPGPPDVLAVARFLARDPARADAISRDLTLRAGPQAVHHLFRVAASLDSLVVGEDQILAQVRAAYGRASDVGLVGTLLGPLFHHALAVGKQVRSETDLARHPVSVVNLAVHALVEHAQAGALRIAVVGAGEMGRLLVRTLAAARLGPALIVNRTPAAARLLAAECAARAVSLDDFRQGLHPVDALVSATAAPGTILSADELLALAAGRAAARPFLGIDLAVPRDLPEIDHPSLRLLDLDDLRGIAERHRALRAEAAAAAEHLVERKVATFLRRFREEAAAPLVTEVRQASEELLGRELEGLLNGRLAHLPEADRRAVERWARATFGRLMHMPTAALKRLAYQMAGSEDGSADGNGSMALPDDDVEAPPRGVP